MAIDSTRVSSSARSSGLQHRYVNKLTVTILKGDPIFLQLPQQPTPENPDTYLWQCNPAADPSLDAGHVAIAMDDCAPDAESQAQLVGAATARMAATGPYDPINWPNVNGAECIWNGTAGKYEFVPQASTRNVSHGLVMAYNVGNDLIGSDPTRVWTSLALKGQTWKDVAFLAGQPANFSPGSSFTAIQNWPYADNTEAFTPPNTTTGVITIPYQSYWKVQMHIKGQQSNDNKELTLRYWLRQSVGGDEVVATYDVATDKTQDRVINATLVLELEANETIQAGVSWVNESIGTYQMAACMMLVETVI